MEHARIPTEIVHWRIWDSPGGRTLKLYLHLVLLAYTKAHESPAMGIACIGHSALADRLQEDPADVWGDLEWLEQAGYVHRVNGEHDTWAIACPEIFDPGRNPGACSDPAATENLCPTTARPGT